MAPLGKLNFVCGCNGAGKTKEVTCHPPKKAGMKFWVVKKRHGKSAIEAKTKNPVSSSYELLWQKLHGSHLSPVSVQNTMRRILEQYFRMNGNLDVSKLDGDCTGKDRQLFRSLFSWVNAGSHDVIDDLYASSDDSQSSIIRTFSEGSLSRPTTSETTT